MSNFFSVTRDFIISAIIAIMTADLLKMNNLIYQIIISVLILVIIFLLLRRFDKLAKRIEILSIIYCESFIRRLLNSLKFNINTTINGAVITKFKIIIILPGSIEEINIIKDKLLEMPKYNLVQDTSNTRSIYVYGKLIEDHQLVVFDTPSLWLSGLNFVALEKKLTKKDISRLCDKLNEDIKSYARKHLAQEEYADQLTFIDLKDFEQFYG